MKPSLSTQSIRSIRFVFVFVALLGLTIGVLVSRFGGNLSAAPPSATDTTQAGLIPLQDITNVTTGYGHSCAWFNDGRVKCWGENTYGQLGDGSTQDRLWPVDVVELGDGVRQVAAGAYFTCALLNNGTVKCWGINERGQLGDDTNETRSTPTLVVGLTGVVKLAAGFEFACAVRQDGTLWCWGANEDGQLGNGTKNDASKPVVVNTSRIFDRTTNLATLDAGESHVCSVTEGSVLVCWGRNQRGQLGLGGTSEEPQTTPVLVTNLTGTIHSITAGGAFTCAISGSNRNLKCWGSNIDGQLGIDSTVTKQTAPGQTAIGSGVIAVAAGSEHACAIVASGGVKCWGENDRGQLGDGSTTRRRKPGDFVVGLTSGVSALAAHDHHVCAVVSGEMRCWGWFNRGQLGDGQFGYRTTAANVVGLAGLAQQVKVGERHVCALLQTGGMQCWGRNHWGQIGNNTTTTQAIPVTPSGLSTGVIAITAGYLQSCAARSTGGGQCWGDNRSGELGDGTTISRTAPVTISGLNSAIDQIAGGKSFTCARTTGGALFCWGNNSFGQLGDGTTTTRPTPGSVTTLDSGVSAISTGFAHACVIHNNRAKCWGQNNAGQLGNNSQNGSLVPIPVANLGDVLAIASGYAHTCALTTGREVYCWGDNTTQQLGTNAFTRALTPVLVAGLNPVSALGAGEHHTCALSGGVAYCWGANDRGQLGNGTTRASFAPVAVSGLNHANTIAAGGESACATTVTGEIKCWGGSAYEQSGDGALSYSTRPVITSVYDTNVQFSQAAQQVGEQNGQVTLALTLDGPSGVPVTVAYITEDETATAGADYTATSGTVRFEAGETQKFITVTVLDDALDEPNETFLLRLTQIVNGEVGGNGQAQVTLVDNDPAPTIRFASAELTVGELAGQAIATVLLSAPSAFFVQVDYSTSNGTATAPADFTAINGTLTFAPGQTEATLTVPIQADEIAEGMEAFTLTLSNFRNATPTAPTVLTIQILDSGELPVVQFSASMVDVAETTPTATIGVTLDRLSEREVRVSYATADETARANSDYLPASGELVFAPGETNKLFTVTILDDAETEADETILLTLHSPSNARLGTATARLTIRDNETLPLVRFSRDSYRVSEAAGTAPITVHLSAATAQLVTVAYAITPQSATPGADYTASNGVVTFPPNTTHQTIPITILQDQVVEPDETLQLTLLDPSNAQLGTPTVATLTIQDDDGLPKVAWAVAQQTVTEDAGALHIHAQLNKAASTPVQVTVTTSDGTATALSDYTPQNQPVTFPPGTLSMTVTVPIVDDAVAPLTEQDETFSLVLSNPNGAELGMPASALITILDDDPGAFLGMITHYPAQKWHKLGVLGLNAQALAVTQEGQLFAADRRLFNDGGGLYTTGLSGGCLNAPPFTRIPTVAAQTTGVAFLGPRGVVATFNQKPYFTSNGGVTWQQTTGNVSARLQTVTTSNQDFYVGATSDGIYRSSDSGQQWTRQAQQPQKINRLLALNNALWVATDDTGVWVLDVGANQPRQQSDGLLGEARKTWDFASDPTYLYVATLDGVYRLNRTGGTWQPFGLHGEQVYSLEVVDDVLYAGLRDPDNRGKLAGVWRRALVNSQWEVFNSPAWVISEWDVTSTVRDLVYDGTYCGGLLAATDNGVWVFR
jgi:alpha-tubulin suppressor-like RCC1 family protein